MGRTAGIAPRLTCPAIGDGVIVAELGQRFRCFACGSRNVDARPDWQQYAAHYRATDRA